MSNYYIGKCMNCLKCLLELEQGDSHYGLHKACFTAWLKAPVTSEFLSLSRKHSTETTPENTSFFHGRFKKYSAELNGASYILKMREDDAPELPEVEYVCNQIGRLLEIPVAEFFIIKFDDDKVFVTKNFIPKLGSPVDLQHIKNFRSDAEHTCEDLIRIIAEKTKRPYDVGVFIQTLLFDALIGNHDRHGRNIGLVVTASGMVLSPVYDNTSYLGLEKGSMLKCDFNPTGKISTKLTYEPSMTHYVQELKRLDRHDYSVDFYNKIKIHQINKLIQESFCSDLMKDAMINLISKRYKELENELKA